MKVSSIAVTILVLFCFVYSISIITAQKNRLGGATTAPLPFYSNYVDPPVYHIAPPQYPQPSGNVFDMNHYVMTDAQKQARDHVRNMDHYARTQEIYEKTGQRCLHDCGYAYAK